MTTKTKRCPSCGAMDSITPTTPSRTITYRSVSLTIPPLSIPECGSCHDMQLDDAQSDIYSAAIDAAYQVELSRRAVEALDRIVPAVTTQKHLEELLQLSHGYISKLRTAQSRPSASLVCNLAVLAIEPKKRIEELERYWAHA